MMKNGQDVCRHCEEVLPTDTEFPRIEHYGVCEVLKESENEVFLCIYCGKRHARSCETRDRVMAGEDLPLAKWWEVTA